MSWFEPTNETRPIINGWSVFHFVIPAILGLIIGYIGLPIKKALISGLAILIVFELLEQTIGISTGLANPPELLLDSILDVIIGFIGYSIGYLGGYAFCPPKRKRQLRKR